MFVVVVSCCVLKIKVGEVLSGLLLYKDLDIDKDLDIATCDASV
jgi:hypothetical protein